MASNNLIIKMGYGLGILFLSLLILLAIASLVSSTFNFSIKFVYFSLLLICYILYVKFVIVAYYKQQVLKIVKTYSVVTLRIDKMLTHTVQSRVFNYFGMGASTKEYYFTFYNKKLSKNVTVSVVGAKPKYSELNLTQWNHRDITVYIDKKKLKHSKYVYKDKLKLSTIRVFRFTKDSFNLEEDYELSISEDIAREQFLVGLCLLLLPIYLCAYLIYYIIHNEAI